MRDIIKGVTPKRVGLVLCLVLWLLVCGQIEGPGCGAPKPENLNLSRTIIEFGNVTVGASKIQQIVVKNKNDETISVTALDVTDDAFKAGLNDQVQTPQLPLLIAGGSERVLYIRFTPQAVRAYSGKLVINSISQKDRSETDNVDLKGIGVP